MKNSSLLIFLNIFLSTALFSHPALANKFSTKEKQQTKTNSSENNLTPAKKLTSTTNLTPETNLTSETNLTPVKKATPTKAEVSPQQNKNTPTSSTDTKTQTDTNSKKTTLTTNSNTSETNLTPETNLTSETSLTPVKKATPTKAEVSSQQNKNTPASSTDTKTQTDTNSKKTTLTTNSNTSEKNLTPATKLTPTTNLTPATKLTPVKKATPTKAEVSPQQNKNTPTSSTDTKTQTDTNSKKTTLTTNSNTSESIQEEKQNPWSIKIENSLLLNHNKLLPKSEGNSNFLENHSLSIPYTDISFNYNLMENIVFELELELSYQNNDLTFDLDDLFFVYSEDSLLLPFSIQWGKFRMDYIKSNSKLFHKKTLVHQALFPYGDRALGASLKVPIAQDFSILTGWQAYHNKRETDGFHPQSPSSSLSGYLLYKRKEQKAFIGYLQTDFILEGLLSSYGVGGDFKYSYKDWSFQLKTELWKINKTQPNRNINSYYLFPYLRWNVVGMGWLIGSSQEKLSKAIGQQFESLLKLDYYFTANNSISIERVQEYSSLFTKNSWNFAIKSDFSL